MVMPNYIGFAELKGVGEGDSYQIMHYVNVVYPSYCDTHLWTSICKPMNS